MTVDKNGVELKAGDTVKMQGVVIKAPNRSLLEIELDSVSNAEVCPELVEFISRPEPTVSVDLTQCEIASLLYGAGGETYKKLIAASKELHNEA